MKNERWLPVAGYKGRYEVSNQGRVFSCPRRVPNSNGKGTRQSGGVILKDAPHVISGHPQVNLYDDNGIRKTVWVHQLVLTAFVGPCPAGREACHNNGIPSDNRVENLRWDTRSSNTFDRFTHTTRKAFA